MPTSSSQSGNVLFYILIAVALFGALGFAVSNMMRSSSGGSIGKEKAGILADDVLSYAHVMREGVSAVVISNACADEQVSFERSPYDGSDDDYSNPNSPAGLTCHVFHKNGGGVNWIDVNPQMNDGQGTWYFHGDYAIDGLGGDDNDPELLMMLAGLKDSLCEAINARLGHSKELFDDTSISEEPLGFIGEYTQEAILGAGNPDDFEKEIGGCFYNAPTEMNIFYYTLVVR